LYEEELSAAVSTMPAGYKATLGALFLLGWGTLARAHDVISTKVTWSREVSRIVYRRCAGCHNGKGVLMSLLTYEDARPWAKAIKEEVLARRMPPWNAIKGFGPIKDDKSLTQDEIALIADWVEGGAPEGDPALLPPAVPRVETQSETPRQEFDLEVNGSVVLHRGLTIAGIRPQGFQAGSSVRITAERPDGSIEPLLWVYESKPDANRRYLFRTPLQLPAGTRIATTPASQGRIAFLTDPAVRSAQKRRR
jgi:hypothetical protein